MWLFTTLGFFSCTVSTDDARMMQIRARVEQDLHNLQESLGVSGTIRETPAADYRWRLIVDPEQFQAIVIELAKRVTYTNFKSEVHHTPGQEDKRAPYAKIWAVMNGLQQGATDHHLEFQFGAPAQSYAEDESPEWLEALCECGHVRGDHQDGSRHCLGGNGTCDCMGFSDLDPLDNPKAPTPPRKELRKSRKTLDARRQKGGGK